MMTMDISKAFYAIPHGLPLLLLDVYGVANTTHTWIVNFLKYIKQRTVVEVILLIGTISCLVHNRARYWFLCYFDFFINDFLTSDYLLMTVSCEPQKN